MKKYAVSAVILLCVALLAGPSVEDKALSWPAMGFMQPTIESVRDHSVAVVTYFAVPKDQIEGIRIKLAKEGITSRQVSPGWPYVLPIKLRQDEAALAIIGSATLVKQGYVVSVAHMFQLEDDKGQPLRRLQSWILQRHTDHPVPIKLVCCTDLRKVQFQNDYAVAQLTEDLGLPGIEICDTEPAQADPVMFTGTVAGAAYFARFGFLTEFHYFFRADDRGQLHLSKWCDAPFWTVYPGGGGDSGGGIFNTRGELIGIMYCGMKIADEQYVFSNSLCMLRDYLKQAGFEKLL